MSAKLIGALALAACAVAVASAAVAEPGPAYAVVEHIKIPDGGYDFVSFDPALHRLYVSRRDGVTALDAQTGMVTGQLAPAQRSHAVLPLEGGATLLVTDSGSNSAHLVEAASGKSLADIATGGKPDAAVFDPSSDLALVMNGGTGDVTLIDPAARKAVGSIPVGGALESAASDGAGKLFINIEDQNRIAVVDMRARAVVGHYALAGCDGPTGLAYAQDAGVLIAACANHVAKVVRASDGQAVASLDIGAGPDQVAYDPTQRLAFIPCGRDGVMDIVAVRGPKDVAVVQVVKTQTGARTGAVDPQTGKVYLPAARFVAAPAGGKPVAQLGTFEILVVAPAR
jgi:DNA-binding beta-propeller fold protein YncE